MRETGEIPHILVVDDDPTVLRLFQLLLIDLGFQAGGFQDPEEAVAALASNAQAYDLILCDYSMPGMDGYAFAQALREFDRETPIILSSGYAREQFDHDRMGGLGITGCVFKPVQKADLYVAVLNALTGRTG